ncbi:RING finger 151-like [Paramuricea clavata]|uniref:RING finger 151-like n=1 Tax=Paramuricea clavata TaxID=317549 RepID=A0A6S7IWT4_PARCT|nr:RING finger 151-like [Paramuricea clavata]
MVDKDRSGFQQVLVTSVIVIISTSLVKSLVSFVSGVLYVNWRGSLTRFIQKFYFAQDNYYELNVLQRDIDNLDQRITQDVDKFSNQFSNIFSTLVIYCGLLHLSVLQKRGLHYKATNINTELAFFILREKNGVKFMASYIQGYDEERFASKVNRNFLCLICFNVLKDPVLCPRNQHCFCRACITKHLENSQRCPTCANELTVETLAKPQRMIKDYLDELNIHCVYNNRGCEEIVQLQHLDNHEATCGFTPAVCTNPDCGVILSQRDLVNHESELCEFRKLKCNSCGPTAITLGDRMATMATNLATVETNVRTSMTKMATVVAMETCMNDVQANVQTQIANVEKNMERNTANTGKLEAVNNEMKGLKTALIEGLDEMKDVLVKMEDKIEGNARKVRNTASGDKENIIVAGGNRTNSVEMFNWRRGTWSPLQSSAKKRWGATLFVYNNHVTIAGGCCFGLVDDMIRMNINPYPDLSTHWSDCPVKLPGTLAFHSSVLYNDQLIVTGGNNGNAVPVSDCIDEVQLTPPYTAKTLSRMPEPRMHHSTQLFGHSLLIVGGSTTFCHQDSLSSVVLYDIKKNECKQLAPLPYEVSGMATVRWGDNIIVIGGIDKCGNVLDTVIIYNVKTEQSHLLPPMRCKRQRFTAVVIGNNIVVLGGRDAVERDLKSVEAFNFESCIWQELPEMSRTRWWHTAVVV